MINKLDVKRFGLALGVAFALAYAGCVLVMFTVPRDTTIRFFNSLMHGVNIEPIVRWDVPISEALLGLGQTFILGWLFGALIAAVYNVSHRGALRGTE